MKKTICAIAPGSVADLLIVKQLIEEGKLKPFVDKTFPMEQAILAHRYLEEGKALGKVVIGI
jgi:NADPH:quinone reductase-like Zn-dependent oxidoreductase